MKRSELQDGIMDYVHKNGFYSFLRLVNTTIAEEAVVLRAYLDDVHKMQELVEKDLRPEVLEAADELQEEEKEE